MDVTIVGLQNAGKTSLLRVLAVSCGTIMSLGLPHQGMGTRADFDERVESLQLSKPSFVVPAISHDNGGVNFHLAPSPQ